jgi:NAD(P)-dependent dehydrogenase (short-subunit alcohol dehydrogenase family)
MNATALITGGTGGLGSAVVEEFRAHGWRVIAPHRHTPDPTATNPSPAGAGELVTLEADLFEAADVSACVQAACSSDRHPLAAVVNLIGGFSSGGRVHETPVEDFERQFRLNLRATYLVCAAALPALLTRGEGAIVCVGTRATERPFPGAAGYISAKAALLGLVDALNAEYGADGIRTNAVLPGVIDTPANRSALPDADRSGWVPPAQIASVIRFLCSPESAPTSGARVPVYGRA